MATRMDRLRRTITKLVVPTGDLGLSQSDVPPLDILSDVPVVLALQAVQTPNGPRLVQAGNNGSPLFTQRGFSVPHPSAAETATWTGPWFDATQLTAIVARMSLTALTGTTPTVRLRMDGSWDGGATTPSLVGPAQITAAGEVLMTAGMFCSASAPAIIPTFANYCGPLPPLMRFVVAIGGTAPSATFSLWAALQ